MELRREPRYELDQPVRVTRLEEPVASFSGTLSNFSANGLQIMMNEGLALGTVVKVEWRATLLLAEVVYCRAEEDSFQIGLELEHAFYDTDVLATLQKTEMTPA